MQLRPLIRGESLGYNATQLNKAVDEGANRNILPEVVITRFNEAIDDMYLNDFSSLTLGARLLDCQKSEKVLEKEQFWALGAIPASILCGTFIASAFYATAPLISASIIGFTLYAVVSEFGSYLKFSKELKECKQEFKTLSDLQEWIESGGTAKPWENKPASQS